MAFNGFVINNSNVPVVRSSEKLRILRAGTSNRKSQGERSKKVDKLPMPMLSILKGVSKNQSNKVFVNK